MQTKTIFIKSILILFFVFSSFFSFFSKALATVGGETIITDLRYDEKKKVVYFYSKSSSVGGGISVLQYDLQTEKIEIFSHTGFIMSMFPEEEREKIAIKYGCPFDNNLESCVENKKWEEFEKIKKELSLLKPLSRIDLKKNGIDIKVAAVSREGLVPLGWGYGYVNFVATVIQNNQEKKQIKFNGCYFAEGYDSVEKKHIEPSEIELKANFDGFYVPNSDTILLLISIEKGICDEGGYLWERVFPITGIKITDSTPLPLREYEQCLAEIKQCGDKQQECYDESGNYELCHEIARQCRETLVIKGCHSLWSNAIPSTGGIFVDLSFDTKNVPVAKEEDLDKEDVQQESATQPPADTKAPSLLKLVLLGVVLIAILILLAVILFKMKKPVQKK